MDRLHDRLSHLTGCKQDAYEVKGGEVVDVRLLVR